MKILKMMIIVIMIRSLSSKYPFKIGESCWQLLAFQKKIDKRGRKLIDFDAERHAVQQMQNNPNRNEAKFVRAKVDASRVVMRKPTAKIIWYCNYHSQCDKLNNKASQESMENAKRTYEILNSGDRAFKLLERGAFKQSIYSFNTPFWKILKFET